MKKEFLETIISEYNQSKKSTVDLLSLMQLVASSLEGNGVDIKLGEILREVAVEIVGLSTESSSLKHKVVESSTRKAITEYMLTYLQNIESNIINNSKTKLRLQQKLKKMIFDYKNTNYFQEIIIATVTDSLIDSIYGDDCSLSGFIEDLLYSLDIDKNKIIKFIDGFREALDSTAITDLKIAFRKTILEKTPDDDVFCDIWLSIQEITNYEICFKIFNSFNEFKAKKQSISDRFISPLLTEEGKNNLFGNDKYKVVFFNGMEYFIGTIKTFEDNDTKFERFITKLKSYDYKNEAEMLHIYITSNMDLLTDEIINQKFSTLPPRLYEELLELNETKFIQATIGHIIVSNPTVNIYDINGEVNFVIRMLFDSIYKMSEILLINDYEFQEFQKEMLITLQQISQLRDIETAHHQDRVTIYTKILAEAILEKKEQGKLSEVILNNNLLLDSDYFIIDKEYIRDLVYSASLHDLGKVGIDDIILKSPNKLSDDEYNHMKKHTIFGNQRLSSIVKISRKKSFLILAAGLAENHHERWDGKGYPNGKKGLEIPLSARVLTVADVYDALRIKRTYKRNFSHKEAFEYIVSQKGIQFDPVIVDIFIENAKLFDEAFKKS